MCIVPLVSASTTTATPETKPTAASAAEQLGPQQRLRIALDILASQDISKLPQQHQVSRKFTPRQRKFALDALDRAFIPADLPPDQKVLFHLPVTRQWLEQLSLALVLIC